MSDAHVDRCMVGAVPLSMDTVLDLHTLSDEELLAVSQRSPGAYEVLLGRYRRLFFGRAVQMVKSPDDAEDVVQEAFVRIYRFAHRFEAQGGSFRAWAMTILMNVARTRYAKGALERSRLVPLLPEQYESLGSDREREVREARDVVDRALAGVPEDAARIMRLAFLDGMPYDRIAEQEGISVGAVKTRVHRAKKVLAKTIGSL